MSMKKIEILLAYIINNRFKLECDYQQLQSNIRYRNIDAVDCLELIIAQERLRSFNEFSAQSMEILNLSVPEEVRKQYITVDFLKNINEIKKGSAKQ